MYEHTESKSFFCVNVEVIEWKRDMLTIQILKKCILWYICFFIINVLKVGLGNEVDIKMNNFYVENLYDGRARFTICWTVFIYLIDFCKYEKL